MDKREYLRSQGFEVGERGRFSAEMLEALKSFKGKETQISLSHEINAAGLSEKIVRTPLRDSQQLYGYDKEGHKIGFIICFKCNDHMMWCECPLITAPSSVATCRNPLVRVQSRMVQSTSR